MKSAGKVSLHSLCGASSWVVFLSQRTSGATTMLGLGQFAVFPKGEVVTKRSTGAIKNRRSILFIAEPQTSLLHVRMPMPWHSLRQSEYKLLAHETSPCFLFVLGHPSGSLLERGDGTRAVILHLGHERPRALLRKIVRVPSSEGAHASSPIPAAAAIPGAGAGSETRLRQHLRRTIQRRRRAVELRPRNGGCPLHFRPLSGR